MKTNICFRNIEDTAIGNLFTLAAEAKTNGDYDTVDMIVVVLLEIARSNNRIKVQYADRVQSEDDYLDLVCFIYGEKKVNMPVPLLNEIAMIRVHSISEKRIVREYDPKKPYVHINRDLCLVNKHRKALVEIVALDVLQVLTAEYLRLDDFGKLCNRNILSAMKSL